MVEPGDVITALIHDGCVEGSYVDLIYLSSTGEGRQA